MGPAGPARPLLGLAFDEVFEARLDELGRFVHSTPSEQRVLALARSGGLLYLSATPPARRGGGRGAAPRRAAGAAGRAVRGDAALQQQLERAARLVDSPIHLLVHGETGSGRYFAKALHAASARAAFRRRQLRGDSRER